MDNTPILKCSVCFDGCAHDAWKGRVHFRENESAFCSELEMLRIIDGLLEARPGRNEKEET